MNDNLYLFVGRSASGKTTVAETLEQKFNFNSLQSYTTRPRRYENETGHVFISEEDFDKLRNIVAYTEYNGYRYGATKDQIDCINIYVIDVPGVETLLQNYDSERNVVVIYFDTSIRTRIDRMIDRRDCNSAIISRLYNDEEFDWENELQKIVWNYKNNMDKHVQMHIVDANADLYNVLAQVVNIIENSTEAK